MDSGWKERAAKSRLEKTKALAAEVKAGVYVNPQINVTESWYPIRAKIKKDPNALEFIFDSGKVNSSSVPE